MASEGIPENWAIADLQDIVQINPKHLKNMDPSIDVTFVPMKGVSATKWQFDFSESRKYYVVRKNYTHFAENDVLFAKITPCMENGKGAVAKNLINGLGCGTTELHILRPYEGIEPFFIYYFLKQESFRKHAYRNMTGTAGQLRVPVSFVKNTPLPLAPSKEQHRIVAKLEKLLQKVDACKERLDKIPAILKRFRQSILAAACSGRITGDWREKREIKENNELPSEWKWMEIEKVVHSKGGIFDGPFGSNLKTVDYTDVGVRVIRLENIGHLRFIDEKTSYISNEKYRTLTKHTVGEGDIIFASFIADEIRICILPCLKTKAIAKADCFCLRPNEDVVDRKFFAYQLASDESYTSLKEKIHGVTRPRINITQLRKIEIKVCPLPEQREIVRRVEALFKITDQIEERYHNARAYIDKLTQSILAKAFRGELVPQDPNDEPASELLKRIKEEKTKSETEAKSTKRGRKSKTKA